MSSPLCIHWIQETRMTDALKRFVIPNGPIFEMRVCDSPAISLVSLPSGAPNAAEQTDAAALGLSDFQSADTRMVWTEGRHLSRLMEETISCLHDELRKLDASRQNAEHEFLSRYKHDILSIYECWGVLFKGNPQTSNRSKVHFFTLAITRDSLRPLSLAQYESQRKRGML